MFKAWEALGGRGRGLAVRQPSACVEDSAWTVHRPQEPEVRALHAGEYGQTGAPEQRVQEAWEREPSFTEARLYGGKCSELRCLNYETEE